MASSRLTCAPPRQRSRRVETRKAEPCPLPSPFSSSLCLFRSPRLSACSAGVRHGQGAELHVRPPPSTLLPNRPPGILPHLALPHHASLPGGTAACNAPPPERLSRLPPERVVALPQAIAEQAVATSRCARAPWHCTATSPPLEGRHRWAARFFDAGAACSRGQAATGRPRPRRAVPWVRVVPVILAALLRRHRCRSCRLKP